MEADLSPRILVLGHSFVWRIARFVDVNSLPCVASTFHLPGEPVVRFHGIGGRTLPKLLHFDLLAVATIKPTIVILEIGSNDLCSPNIDVSSLANDIFAFVQLLHIRFSVKHIIVSQILPRKKSPPMRPAYNHRVSPKSTTVTSTSTRALCYTLVSLSINIHQTTNFFSRWRPSQFAWQPPTLP